MISLKLKQLNFKAGIIILVILVTGIESYSQSVQGSSPSKYEKFLPDYVKIQYAGGIGFISLGVGYTFFEQKLDVSYFYGYVPEFVSSKDLHSISLQLTAKLLQIKINRSVELMPLNFRWFIHHTFGDEYWIKLPSNYPEKYYWWSPGINPGVFLGGEIKTKFLSNKTPASGTTFYIRLGSRALYISSKFGNSSIPKNDITEFGFGVAVYR